MRSISSFLIAQGIKTNNFHLYEEALTHRSYSNEYGYETSYERLEFLGDAIIEKVVVEYLFTLNISEGEMSKIKIQMVQSSTLIRAAKELGLDQVVLLGKGLQNDPSPSIFEDVFEAFIAAIYLDKGEKKVKQIINRTLVKYHRNDDLDETIDYKTLLQELLQNKPDARITYDLVHKKKLDDQNTLFTVKVWWDGICYGQGTAKKQKEAEKLAAKNAYQKIASNKE